MGTRRVKGAPAGQGGSWANETIATPLPVRRAWPLLASGPVVWVDATGRLDVKDLARAHREASEGEVFTQCGAALSPSLGVQVVLLVRFRRPVRTEFALAFAPDHLETLASIATAGAVSMVTREPKMRNGAIEGRNAVTFEIDQPGLLEMLAKLPALHAMAEMLTTRKPE